MTKPATTMVFTSFIDPDILVEIEADAVLSSVDVRRTFVDLVEPIPPPVPEHWELGLSELGESSDLH